MKRALDFVLAAAALTVLALPMAAVAIAVRATSGAAIRRGP